MATGSVKRSRGCGGAGQVQAVWREKRGLLCLAEDRAGARVMISRRLCDFARLGRLMWVMGFVCKTECGSEKGLVLCSEVDGIDGMVLGI